MDTWFTTSTAGVWIFKALVFLNPFLLAVWLGQVFKVRWWLWLTMFGVLEMGVWSYLQWLPTRQHRPTRGATFFRNMVLFLHRNVVQFDPALSQFDPELYYTLKPNLRAGTFRNLEYSVAMRANRAGVRDDDASLEHPEVIFLGDSFTMGWGVPDSACFVSQLKKKLACKTLNAGVSSYGTARESIFLKRLQTDSCKLLVIQYCTNDDIENEELTRLQFKFKPAQPEVYQGYVHFNALTSDYYPFKFIFLVAKTALSFASAGTPHILRSQTQSATPPAKQTPLPSVAKSYSVNFFAVLSQIRHLYHGPILIFNLEGTATRPEIIREFSRYLTQHPMPGIYLADVSPVLTRNDYYVFDDHITAQGHHKVASRLYESIRQQRLLP